METDKRRSLKFIPVTAYNDKGRELGCSVVNLMSDAFTTVSMPWADRPVTRVDKGRWAFYIKENIDRLVDGRQRDPK